MAQVEGSGTGTGLARRKPPLLLSLDGAPAFLREDNKLFASLSQGPPRSPREVVTAEPVRSFHSVRLPLISKVTPSRFLYQCS